MTSALTRFQAVLDDYVAQGRPLPRNPQHRSADRVHQIELARQAGLAAPTICRPAFKAAMERAVAAVGLEPRAPMSAGETLEDILDEFRINRRRLPASPFHAVPRRPNYSAFNRLLHQAGHPSANVFHSAALKARIDDAAAELGLDGDDPSPSFPCDDVDPAIEKRVRTYLNTLASRGEPLPQSRLKPGVPDLKLVGMGASVAYQTLRRSLTLRALVCDTAAVLGFRPNTTYEQLVANDAWRAHPHRLAVQAGKRMEAYIASLRRDGKKLPCTPLRPTEVCIHHVAQATGLGLPTIRGDTIARALLLAAVRDIGLIDPTSPEALSMDLKGRAGRRLQREVRLRALLNELERLGQKLPHSPHDHTVPAYEYLAKLAGITTTTPPRFVYAVVDEYAERLGIGSWLAPVRANLTYSDLEHAVQIAKAKEAKATKTLAVALRVRKSALKRFRDTLGKSADAPVAGDFALGFDEAVERIVKRIANVRTRGKWLGEIRRIRDIALSLCVEADDLPRHAGGAIAELVRRANAPPRTVASDIGLTGEEATRFVQWACRTQAPLPGHIVTLAKIEAHFALPPNTLIGRVDMTLRRGRFRRAHYPGILHNDRLRERVLPLLPKNFFALPEPLRTRIAEDAVLSLEARESRYRTFHRSMRDLRYRLNDFPAALNNEWKHLVDWKTDPTKPVFPKRNTVWRESTVPLARTHLARFFGFLTLPREDGGMGAARETLSLAHMASPELCRRFLRWIQGRRGHFNAGDRLFLAFVAMLLQPETGWLSQQPAFAERLVPVEPALTAADIRAAQENWTRWCADALTYAVTALDDDDAIELSRDPFAPIRKILEQDEPIAALDLLFDRVVASLPLATGLNKKEQALGVRDIVLVGLAIETRLRRKNISCLTYCRDNTGQLREEDGRYVVVISWKLFKNRYGPFFGTKKRKKDYYQVLPDYLTPWLDDYLLTHREELLEGHPSDKFFIARGAAASEADRMDEAPPRMPRRGGRSMQMLEASIGSRFKELTRRHLAYNVATGGGIPGVEPFGIHAVRDIVATHIVATTGSFALAADAIHDSEQVCREHYADFDPKRKTRLVDEILHARRSRKPLPRHDGLQHNG